MISITILGSPRTKKNSQRMLKNRKTGKSFPAPSKAYTEYAEAAGYQIRCKGLMLSVPHNVQCVYYMPTRGLVDLCNLLEATCDILKDNGVVEDDNSKIVATHDGSRVDYDKENPRVEITITEVETDGQK